MPLQTRGRDARATWQGLRGATGLLVLSLLLAIPVEAAKPNKPEKPDRNADVDNFKPDKVKPFKSGQSDKVPKPERAVEFAPPARATKSSRSERSSGRSSPPPATTPATPAGRQFDDFLLITERNIFNPNRVGRVHEKTAEPPRIDSVALVGVLQSDTGVVAFFDSADRAFRTTLREGETIGGLPLARILPNGVELMQEGQRLFLRVNQQMRRAEGGSWRVIPREPGQSAMARAGDPAAPAIPPGASEVLRRLMEQRQKQLKQ